MVSGGYRIRKKITEGRKANRASETKRIPPPPPRSRSESVTDDLLITTDCIKPREGGDSYVKRTRVLGVSVYYYTSLLGSGGRSYEKPGMPVGEFDLSPKRRPI